MVARCLWYKTISIQGRGNLRSGWEVWCRSNLVRGVPWVTRACTRNRIELTLSIAAAAGDQHAPQGSTPLQPFYQYMNSSHTWFIQPPLLSNIHVRLSWIFQNHRLSSPASHVMIQVKNEDFTFSHTWLIAEESLWLQLLCDLSLSFCYHLTAWLNYTQHNGSARLSTLSPYQ